MKPAHNSLSLDAVGYYGADIVQDIIVGAQLSEITTANGAKILDWTSGQVSQSEGERQFHPVVTILRYKPRYRWRLC
jgi:hypothetical protein